MAAAAKYAKANAWIEHTLRISPAVVGWVIGKGGVHIRDVIEGSGAKVWIDQESMGPEEMRIVYVKGKKDCVNAAVEMVKDLAYDAPYVGGPHTVVDEGNNEEGAAKTSSASQQKPAPPATLTKRDSVKVSSPNLSQQQTCPPQCQPARAEPVSPELPSPTQEPAPVSAPAIASSPAPAPVAARTPAPVQEPDTAPSQPVLQDNADSFLKPPEPDDMGMPLQLSPSYDAGGEMVPQQRQNPAVVSPAPGFSPFSTPGPNPAPAASVPPTQGTGSGGASSLLTFLESQKACLKGSPSDFQKWLSESEDISTIEDLAEAVKDDAYMKEVLQPGDGSVGVKGFKRAAFKKAAVATVENANEDDVKVADNGTKQDNLGTECTSGAVQAAGFASSGSVSPGLSGSSDIPTELICPITHVLMVQDPVLAADGMTYERSAIQMWFERQRSEVEVAQRELMVDPTSQRARSIVERGVLSPVTHTKMPSLSLISNVALRTMARDVSSSQPLY